MESKYPAAYLTSRFELDPMLLQDVTHTNIEEMARSYLANKVAEQIIERNDQIPLLLERIEPGPSNPYGEIKLTLLVVDPKEYKRLKRIEQYAQGFRMMGENGPLTISQLVDKELKQDANLG